MPHVDFIEDFRRKFEQVVERREHLILEVLTIPKTEIISTKDRLNVLLRHCGFLEHAEKLIELNKNSAIQVLAESFKYMQVVWHSANREPSYAESLATQFIAYFDEGARFFSTGLEFPTEEYPSLDGLIRNGSAMVRRPFAAQELVPYTFGTWSLLVENVFDMSEGVIAIDDKKAGLLFQPSEMG